MKTGTPQTKIPNPRSAPLGKFLRMRERHVRAGYVQLRTGQIVREETAEWWKAEGRRAR